MTMTMLRVLAMTVVLALACASPPPSPAVISQSATCLHCGSDGDPPVDDALPTLTPIASDTAGEPESDIQRITCGYSTFYWCSVSFLGREIYCSWRWCMNQYGQPVVCDVHCN